MPVLKRVFVLLLFVLSGCTTATPREQTPTFAPPAASAAATLSVGGGLCQALTLLADVVDHAKPLKDFGLPASVLDALGHPPISRDEAFPHFLKILDDLDKMRPLIEGVQYPESPTFLIALRDARTGFGAAIIAMEPYLDPSRPATSPPDTTVAGWLDHFNAGASAANRALDALDVLDASGILSCPHPSLPVGEQSLPPESLSPANTSQATSSADARAGTRDNPYALGDEFILGDWRIAIDTVKPDAWSQIHKENQFNDPPTAGRQFVMFHVTATYTGDTTASPMFDLLWTIVGSRGNTFGASMNDHCGVIPDAFINQGELFTGATAKGNVCVSVSADQIKGGTIQVKQFLDNEPAFIALQ